MLVLVDQDIEQWLFSKEDAEQESVYRSVQYQANQFIAVVRTISGEWNTEKFNIF